MSMITLDLVPPDNLPDDGEEITAVTDHGIFTGRVRYCMIDNIKNEPLVIDVIVGGAVGVRWESVIGWFYFDCQKVLDWLDEEEDL